MRLFAWGRMLPPIVALLPIIGGCDSIHKEASNKRTAAITIEEGSIQGDDLVVDSGDGLTQGFKEGFHLLMQQNCGDCHDSVEPTFTHPDSDLALKTTKNWVSDMPGFEGKPLVNFGAITESRLVSILSNDAHYCWTSDCTSDAKAMESAIKVWDFQATTVESPNASPNVVDPENYNDDEIF